MRRAYNEKHYGYKGDYEPTERDLEGKIDNINYKSSYNEDNWWERSFVHNDVQANIFNANFVNTYFTEYSHEI